MNECSICIEPFSKQKHKKIRCEYCDFSACRKCMEKWLLEESAPTCMNNDCTREWTAKYIHDNFTSVFINTKLKKHREDVLFDQERALLPATQPIVENMIHAEELQDLIDAEYKKIREIHQYITTLRNQRDDVYNNRNNNRGERSRFIKACPSPDCRGFLSSQWKCGLCNNWTCPDCHEVKGPERNAPHTCDEEAKSTAALINNDTRSCPTCGTGIYKIDGCDQMFCTECHTAFSWRTGRIEQHIHNPHYYEWMRRTGGQIPLNHNEIQCGREINHTFSRTLSVLIEPNRFLRPMNTFVTSLIRQIIHYRFNVLPRHATDRELNNQELRIYYLRNLIDENEFKTILQRNDKKNRKNREIYAVYIVLVNTVTDILYRFYDLISRDFFVDTVRSEVDTRVVVDILREISVIVDYVNECFVNVGKSYGSKPMRFTLWTNVLETSTQRIQIQSI